MLDHQKYVIANVSHDKYLFRKELVKSMRWLNSNEIFELYKWVTDNYLSAHKDVIFEVFSSIAA